MKNVLFRVAILAFSITSCTLLPERHHRIDLTPYPDKILIDVPFYEQSDDLCGPAAMAMLLAWNGVNVELELLHKQIYTSGLEGSLQQDMLGSARRHGMLAVSFNSVDELLQELSQGTPVVLLLNLGLATWPKWHYVVVTGINTTTEMAVIHDGQTANLDIPLSTLLQQWYRGQRWGLVVSQPDRLPASADQHELLNAAIALERVQKTEAAFKVYTGATARYPNFALFWLGRGNTALTLNDFIEAELAFLHALDLDSHNGAAYYNLAAALHSQGRSEEALKFISSGKENAPDFHGALTTLEQRILSTLPN